MATKAFQVIPRQWRGIRDSEAPLLLDPNEWASSKNFDSRMGWSGAGSTPVQTWTPANLASVGMRHFFDKSGVIHRVLVSEDGKIQEDGAAITLTFSPSSLVLTDANGLIPGFAPGIGGIVIARGPSFAIIRKDPADNVWKEVLSAPKFTGVSMERAGPRLFGFPNSATETDTVAWSAIGDFTKWATVDGGGSEPIGNDRQPIIGIEAGLQDAMAYYKRDYIYVRNGTDPTSWRITLVSSDVGLTAPLSLIRIGKSHFFVHESGAYFLNAVGAVIFPPLSERIQDSWDQMVKNFGTFIRFAHAAYHPRERTIYCWLPNQASRVMNRLMKVYVPDGSVTLHDGKPAGASDYYRQSGGIMTYANASKVQEVKGLTDDGTSITSEIETGIFAGSPPTPDIEKRWGTRGVVHLYFEAEGAMSVSVTPRVYRGDTQQVGTAQSKTLVANRVTKMAVKMPDKQGWGFDLVFNSTTNLGRWRWLGMSGLYEDVTDA